MGNVLGLEAGFRPGSKTGAEVGKSRSFMDFVVDGEHLVLLLGPTRVPKGLAVKFVPVLVFDWPSGFPAEDFGRLVGAISPSLPDGRVPLYVCAECGDLACGAVTAIIDRTLDTVTWRDFGYQNNYETFERTNVADGVGPFIFDRASYDAVLQQFRDRWRGSEATRS